MKSLCEYPTNEPKISAAQQYEPRLTSPSKCYLIPAADAERYDRENAAKDAVVQAAEACYLRGYGKSDRVRLSYALAALDKVVRDAV